MTDKTTSLIHDSRFRILWASQSLSFLGTYVTFVALPITAITVLDATPFEAGVLGALETLPFLVLGLLVGVFVDRNARRPILFWSNLARFLALAWIPVAYWGGFLTMAQLFVVVLVVGIGTVFFEVAYPSYLPGVFGRQRMIEVNAKLQVSRSAAEVGGPGLTGGLISLVGAPALIVIDAISYAVSAIALLKLPADPPPEPKVEAGKASTSVFRSIRQGFGVIGGHAVLRVCTTAAILTCFFFSGLLALVFLFLIRECGMGASQVGLIMMVGSCGALGGALLAERVTRLLGLGLTLVLALAVPGAGYVLLATVQGDSVTSVVVAAVAVFVASAGIPVFDVTVISLRQAVTPDELLGRVNATVRTLTWGTWSVGSLVGGAVGSALGIREAVFVLAVGLAVPSVYLLLSRVRSVRKADEVMIISQDHETRPDSPAVEEHQ